MAPRFVLSEHDQPWTEDQVIKAIAFNFHHARREIDATDGGRIWAALNEVKDSNWILDQAIDDLLEGINRFAHRSQYQDFWSRVNANNREEYTKNVKRFLFNASSALAALVDHTRNFLRSYPVPGEPEARSMAFKDDNLHRFLFDLRNYSLHWKPAQANWNIATSAGETGVSRTVAFLLSRDELAEWSCWKSEAKEFLDSQPERVDVRELFIEYQLRARKFHSWLQTAAIITHYTNIRKYLEYKKWHDRFHELCTWNAVAAFRDIKRDPYELLRDYLSPREIEHIYSLELKSDEQINRLIDLVDLEQAVDGPLRARLQEFLRHTPRSSSGEEAG